MVVRTLFRWHYHPVTNKRERVRQELLADDRLVEAVVDAVHEQLPGAGHRFAPGGRVPARAVERDGEVQRGGRIGRGQG